jgi:hypothetical protein
MSHKHDRWQEKGARVTSIPYSGFLDKNKYGKRKIYSKY